ncbi:MAG: 3-dehydroquinate synthase [Defluviitaleaceae bacterium]|nr:3-dehydroquinate synthase [Defluviitaleaceae bacterium]
MKTITAGFPWSSADNCEIFIERGLLAHFTQIAEFRKKFSGVKKFAIITDENVCRLYAERVANSLNEAGFDVVIPYFTPGEQSKNIDTFFMLQNQLAENEITRSDAIIALGGGVVVDLAGFVAATYLRGIPFVQMPTTLLAMVDSSVGGKTAIDIPAGKNLVGAFHQPAMVVCDPDTLGTLPAENFADGMAEVIKHAMIECRRPEARTTSALLHMLNSEIPISENSGILADVIEANVKIKRDIVQRDEFDTGERQLLNFGHTIGHAVEKLSSFKISHGSAVAIGMSIITKSAVQKGQCAPECAEILENLLQKYNLPTHTDFSPQEIFEASLSDKKRTGGFIIEVIPRSPGVCELVKMPVGDLLDWI